MKKEFCVLSHTHWDREWYLNFEQFRIKLVYLMDNLLDLLDQESEYVFHLDAQAIVLEDYLEIKPHQKEKLYEYIKNQRIFVGPWYVQNDFYLTSGEATIRNLLIGSAIAEQAGKCTLIGYVPDQFGLISQLPQIFNGFGITDCIFGRGYDFFEKINGEFVRLKKPSELIWEGADASKVFSVHMPYWYNNAQRFSEDLGKTTTLLDNIEQSFTEVAQTPYLLLMNGVDHLEAQEDLLPIIKELNAHFSENKCVQQVTMEEYLTKVKNYINHHQELSLQKYQGEMRNGRDLNILQGTLSSRIYLKTLNVKAQNLMENMLEPIYSMICMAGAQAEYPKDYFLYLWKELIKNHPHDSICGCSIDDVHNNMEDRFQRFFASAEDFLERGMAFLAAHLDRTKASKDDYLITIYNTLEFVRSQVIEVDVEFPVEEAVGYFKILDEYNEEVSFEVVGKKRRNKDMITPINLPGVKEVDCYTIQMLCEFVPSVGYRSFLVQPEAEEMAAKEIAVMPELYTLENDFLKVTIGQDGKINLTSHITNAYYENIISLEDVEDCGDSYVYEGSRNSKTFTTEGLIPEIIEVINGELASSCILKYDLFLPEGYDFEKEERTSELVLNQITIKFSLTKLQRWIDVEFAISNKSKNHRLRAMVHTGIHTDFTAASSPFDTIMRDRREVLNGIKNGTQPNSGFVAIENEGVGLAMLNEGLYEYEHMMQQGGVIGITLLRANGIISWSAKGEQWKVPGNQCIRDIKASFALHPYCKDFYQAEIANVTRDYQVPLLAHFQPVEVKKFLGGRAAVQDSCIDETFMRKDKYSNIRLERAKSFLSVVGEGVVLSAIKLAEKGDGMIVRLYNTLPVINEFSLQYHKAFTKVTRARLDESESGLIKFDGSTTEKIRLNPKEIFTLLLN